MSQYEQGVQRRLEILRFVAGYIEQNGYSPSMQEIGDGTGVHKNGARHHLLKLQSDGLVTTTEGAYRSIRLTDKGRGALVTGDLGVGDHDGNHVPEASPT